MVDVGYKQRQYYFWQQHQQVWGGVQLAHRRPRVCYFELHVLKQKRDYLPLPFLT